MSDTAVTLYKTTKK